MTQKVLGILGGLGPLASAEFIKTIYELNIKESEQNSPICVLYSNPTIPKRTKTIEARDNQVLQEFLVDALDKLDKVNSTKIVIACITMHYYLPYTSLLLQNKVISLIEIIIQEVLNKPQPYLLLCSPRTRKTNVFSQHPKWGLVQPYIVFPNDPDQAVVANCFGEIKLNGNQEAILGTIDTMVDRYGVQGWIAGCTEFHILHKYVLALGNRTRSHSIIDPLFTIAQNLDDFLNA